MYSAKIISAMVLANEQLEALELWKNSSHSHSVFVDAFYKTKAEVERTQKITRLLSESFHEAFPA
jgi:hypothetical protein